MENEPSARPQAYRIETAVRVWAQLAEVPLAVHTAIDDELLRLMQVATTLEQALPSEEAKEASFSGEADVGGYRMSYEVSRGRRTVTLLSVGGCANDADAAPGAPTVSDGEGADGSHEQPGDDAKGSSESEVA